MHEFSICQVLLDGILAELEKNNLTNQKLIKTRVVAGELRQIVPDYLQQAYEVLTKDTVAEGSKLEIQIKAVGGTCMDCKWDGDLPRGEFRCQSCGSGRVDIIRGRELYLESLEVEDGVIKTTSRNGVDK